MDWITEMAEKYAPSARTGFYLLVIYALGLTVATVAWFVSLVLEVTRKRASKLSIKFGSASKEENRFPVAKLVIQAIFIVVAWMVFLLVL